MQSCSCIGIVQVLMPVSVKFCISFPNLDLACYGSVFNHYTTFKKFKYYVMESGSIFCTSP